MEQQFSFMQRVKAKVLKSLAADYVIRKKTLKTLPEAALYLLGEENELAVIKDLDFSKDDLKLRRWSPETRIALLKENNFALAQDCTCQEEYSFICLYSVNEEDILVVLKKYTPNHKETQALFKNFGYNRKFMEVNPNVYNVLEAEDVITTATAADINHRNWEVAKKISDNVPEKALSFMHYILEFLQKHPTTDDKPLADRTFLRFWNNWNKAAYSKKDMSDELPIIYQIYPDTYQYLLKNYERYTDFGSYCLAMLQYWGNLKALTDSDKQNVTQMIDIAIKNDCWNNAEIKEYLENNLQLDSNNSNFLSAIAGNGKYFDLLCVTMACICHEDENGCQIRIPNKSAQKLIEMIPFAGENNEKVQKALVKLVDNNLMPIDKIEDLSEEYKSFVLARMEEESQRLAQKEDILEYNKIVRLQPRAEVEFFTFTNVLLDKQIEYIETYKPSAESYNSWINHLNDKTNDNRVGNRHIAFIMQYAKTWHLNKHEYWALLQSPNKYLGAHVARYVEE